SIDTNGVAQRIPGTVAEFVDSTGNIFNHTWEYEVGTLGFTPPPLPPDGHYPVYIQEFGGSGLYGETVFDLNPIDPGPPPRYSSHVEIENDFMDVYTPTRGIPALQVTAAHEFHHSI